MSEARTRRMQVPSCPTKRDRPWRGSCVVWNDSGVEGARGRRVGWWKGEAQVAQGSRWAGAKDAAGQAEPGLGRCTYLLCPLCFAAGGIQSTGLVVDGRVSCVGLDGDQLWGRMLDAAKVAGADAGAGTSNWAGDEERRSGAVSDGIVCL